MKIEILLNCNINVKNMLLSVLHVGIVGWLSSYLIGQCMDAFHYLNAYSNIITVREWVE